MCPCLVLMEVETEVKKYTKLSNALHFVELQDLLELGGFLCSLYYRIVSTVLCFVTMPLFHYIFATRNTQTYSQGCQIGSFGAKNQ